MRLGIDKLDVVIGTHPHADHIGGLIDVIRELTVKEVIDPGVIHTTKTFEEYLTLIDEKDITFTEGRAGMRRDLGDGVIFEILHPQNPSSQHLNDASVVVRITYGDISFLFAGDAEEASELEMIQRSHDLKSTVLKTGHHGSSTSTSRSFLDAVNPEIAVIMCAEGNTYGHPHAQTLQRLIDSGIDVYRTDISGNIVITTDGSTYRVSAGKMPDETTVVSEDKLFFVSYTGSVAAGEDVSITIKGKPNT